MGDDTFFLEWNNHKQSLTSNLKKLLRAQEFVDVTLVAEGHSIRCHRLVLSACSGFFDSILQGTDSNYPIIVLPPEVKLWHMQGIVDYMYLGELTVDRTGINDFLKSAKMLKIRGLIDVADRFLGGEEEYKPNKNDVEEKIKPIPPDTNNSGTTVENPQQVVSTTTNDTPASINNRDLDNDTNQPIKEADTPGPPPAYQERGPILNNIAGCIQHPIQPESPVSREITRPISVNGRYQYQVKIQPPETSDSQTPTPIDGNSGNFENRPHIKPPVSHTLTAQPPSMGGNSTNLPSYFETPTNRRLISDQSIPPQAFEMLKRINNSPTPGEKRVRLSHPPQLSSEQPKDFHPFHFYQTVPPKMPPLKKNATSKNLRGPARTTPPESQQFQQFNMPTNYGPPPMHLSQPRSALPGPSTNINPHLLPHPSLYIHPNLRAYAHNYPNNFKM